MNEEYAFVTKPGENTVHELKTAEELKDLGQNPIENNMKM